VFYTGADQHGFVDAIAVHLPQQLLDLAAALVIGHRRLIRPILPSMGMRVYYSHEYNIHKKR
jgi:hypothetical protein